MFEKYLTIINIRITVIKGEKWVLPCFIDEHEPYINQNSLLQVDSIHYCKPTYTKKMNRKMIEHFYNDNTRISIFRTFTTQKSLYTKISKGKK